MNIEWAKNGFSHELFIVQAQPLTITQNPAERLIITEYQLTGRGAILAKGRSIGHRIMTGTAGLVKSPADAPAVLTKSDVIVTDILTPDWEPILRKVGAVVTNWGEHTNNAAITARGVGVLAVVGTTQATPTHR